MDAIVCPKCFVPTSELPVHPAVMALGPVMLAHLDCEPCDQGKREGKKDADKEDVGWEAAKSKSEPAEGESETAKGKPAGGKKRNGGKHRSQKRAKGNKKW